MHDFEKFKRKLSEEERQHLIEVVSLIQQGDLSGMDIKKLKAVHNTFRVRIGRYRIKFIKTAKYGYVVVKMERRDDNTYS